MQAYQIFANGTDMGTYRGATEREAIEAYTRDAGYGSVGAAADALGQTVEAFLAGIKTTAVSFGFEALVDGQWSRDAAGTQDASNAFATRAEAEAELPRLAAALECDASELRVVAL